MLRCLIAMSTIQRKGRSSLEDQKHVEMLLATPLWARFSMESYERMRKRTLGQFIPTKLAAGRRFGGCKLTPMGKPCRRLEMLGQAAEKFMGGDAGQLLLPFCKAVRQESLIDYVLCSLFFLGWIQHYMLSQEAYGQLTTLIMSRRAPVRDLLTHH